MQNSCIATVRRNVIVTDEVLDSENSIVIEQANNRTYAAQLVLQKYLKMSNKKSINSGQNWWKHH
jgi:N-succinyl-L-ornithine transcarbamylase